MIGKDEQTEESDSYVDPIKLIANKQKSLEDNTAQVHEEIRNCFAQLREILQLRERQLLRQADAVHTQQLSLVQTSLETLPPLIVNFDGKETLEKHIQDFGRIELSGTNYLTVKDAEPYKVEDYQEANKDHVSFDKFIHHEEKGTQGEPIEYLQSNKQEQVSKPENIIANHGSLFNSSLCSSPAITNTDLRPKLEEVDRRSNSQQLPLCSPRLVINQKLNLPCIESEDKQEDNTKCSHDLINDTETLINETIQYNITNIEENVKETVQTEEDTVSKYIETDFCENEHFLSQADISSETVAKDNVSNQEMLKDSYEHPKQVQQWLQQILVETEIEPMVHDIGQFSQISEAHQLQMET